MRSIAVIPRGFTPDAGRFAQIVHAVNVQVQKDFTPAWHIAASVGYFPRLQDAPPGSSFVLVAPDVKEQEGSHFSPCATDEPPFALVSYTNDETWSVLLSHEILEMLVDPGNQYFESGPDPDNQSRQAKFLVEICDPCMGHSYVNEEAPGIQVADFCLRAYYGLEAGSQMTHRKNIDAPFTVARGGYLTWQNAADEWRQSSARGGQTSKTTLNPDFVSKAIAACNFRGTLDRLQGKNNGASIKKSAVKPLPTQQVGGAQERNRATARFKALEDALQKMGV